jgi:Domain of unknown function (DUF4365)
VALPNPTGPADENDESATSLSTLRGDLADTACMETLQVGYLHAVAAAARCSIATPSPDRRLDWIALHQSEQHTEDNEACLKIALKATAQVTTPKSDEFAFRLENAHLEYLSRPDPTVKRILVVMILPKDIRRWIRADKQQLELRHCCYWVNLEGQQPSGESKTTVKVPAGQIFDDVALCNIMKRIGSGGRP